MAGFIAGTVTYGRIEDHERSYVGTQMAMLNLMPLVPRTGILVFFDGGCERRLAIPLDARSVFAAYGRWWPLLALVIAGALAWNHTIVPAIAIAAPSLLVLAAAWAIGRVGAVDRAQRRVYREVTGASVDVAKLAIADPTQRPRLQFCIEALGRRLDPSSYRTRYDPASNVVEIALEPMVREVAYLCAALTLVRMDRGLASPEQRAGLDRVHDEIWRKLEPMLASGAPIDWSTWHAAIASARADVDIRQPPPSALPAPPPTAPTIDVGPFEKGRAFENGWDVTVRADAYRPPSTCAACGLAAERTRREGKGNVAIDVPYCARCNVHAAYTWSRAPYQEVGLAILFGSAIFGAVAFIPGLPLVASMLLAPLLALPFAVLAIVTIPIRKRVGSSASVDGARLVRTRGPEATLFCTHAEWARSLAEAHGTTPVARARPNRGTPKRIPLAIPLSAAAAVGVWIFANPEVHVDNSMGDAVQVWVDGKPVFVAQPGPVSKLRISHGEHMLGWSRVGAPAPISITTVDIHAGHAPLYAPGKMHCYYREVTIYGKSSEKPSSTPLQIADFYDFSSVDNWFAPNPATVEIEKGSSTTKSSIQRSKWCPDLSTPPCPEGTRERYWSCMTAHWTDPRGAWQCARDTSIACGFEPPADPTGGEWSE
jgi:hypothetical protein